MTNADAWLPIDTMPLHRQVLVSDGALVKPAIRVSEASVAAPILMALRMWTHWMPLPLPAPRGAAGAHPMTPADAWQPIETAPDRPMAVLLHSAHRRFLSFPDDAEIVPDASRAETYDLGYWNGANWHYAMTNHDVFEEGAGRDTPTHWQPLPAPPRNGDGQEPQA